MRPLLLPQAHKGSRTMNRIGRFSKCIFNLGAKSGMPKYTALLGLFQAAVLFIPESVLARLGVDAQKILSCSPSFVQYYIINSSFKNAMSVFWLLGPFTFVICAFLYTHHINSNGYRAYLDRRIIRLKKASKTNDYSLMFGIFAAIILYIWSTIIYLVEPKIIGGFIPSNNRFAMLIIHAGALGFFLPGAFAVLVTEIRASFSATKFFGE